MARKYINLPTHDPKLAFSDAVLLDGTLYLSGRIGIDPKTGQAPNDIDLEINYLLDGVKAVLAAAGMTMDDLFSVQIFCPNLSLYEHFNAVYRSYFTRDLPARAFLGSGPLLRGGHFELMAQARKD